MSTEMYSPGSLVSARGREWVVLTGSTSDVLRVRPISGSEEDQTLIHVGLESDPVREARFPLPRPDQRAGHDAALLLRDALLLSLRRGAGPFRALGQIAVEPRAYQLVPLLMALKLEPVRLLIADDVGIGKTIEAGLIARELLDRGDIERMAVLCPPHLVDQWIGELERRFHLHAVAVTAAGAGRLERGLPPGESIFSAHPHTVVSLDYIKSDRRRSEFLRACPEFVIVDEAHTCTSTGQDRHQRYELLRGLTQSTDRHIVLLTATPHSGDEAAFYRLLGLLDRDFERLADLPDEQRAHLRDRLSHHFVQRRRQDIDEWKEGVLFPRRETKELRYRLTGAWEQLFSSVLDYCADVVQAAEGDERRQRLNFWGTLALMRCVASSPAAAVQALRTRADLDASEDDDALFARVFDGATDALPEDDLEPSAGSDDPVLTRLIAKAEQLTGQTGDPKLKALVEHLRELVADGFSPVVFCRYIATAHYLGQHVQKHFKDVDVRVVTGQLTGEERAAQVEAVGESERRLLIATDCLSEGVNLQGAFDAVVHYDLSWNPTRHEQREGRVDRFGQPSPVVRATLMYGDNNPVDGAVLDVIIRKARKIRDELGVAVPLPDEGQALTQVLLKALLLRRGGRAGGDNAKQLQLFEESWEEAAARTRRGRATVFAQRRLKPEEVLPEWHKTIAAVGGRDDVQRFTARALARLGSGLEPLRRGFKAPLDGLPVDVQERLDADGLEGTVLLDFNEPPAARCRPVQRTHPIVSVRGVDVDGLTHAQRRALTHRMEAALRQLDERSRVYQYLIKRAVDTFVAPVCAEAVAQEALTRRTAYLNDRRRDLYRLAQYMVLLHEPALRARTSTRLERVRREPREALRRWLSTQRSLRLLESELDHATGVLEHKAETFESQLADFGPQRLGRADAFRFFRQLVNYDPTVLSATASNTPASYLDYFVADSPVECHRDHLMVGSQLVKVLSMKEPPCQTFAHILGDLLAVPGELIACLEWQRVGQDRMRRDIQSRRRHFFNKRVSMINYVTPAPEAKGEEMLVDESATATVKQLGDALTEMEVNGHVFGRCSLTVVLHHEDRRALDHQVAQAMKVLAAHDGAFFDETYNLLNAWLSIVPGNGAHNLRRLALLETHAADLSFLFGIDQGQSGSALLARPLATFETPHNTPFAYHLHVQDVGHTLVLGATGSGKSFLLNFMVTSAQQYDPFTIVLDLGHGYRKLAALLHGGYVELGLRQRDVSINPFSLEPTPEHLHFLHGFVRVLLEGEDGYRLSEHEDREVYEAVENLYVLDRNQRRLFTLANLLPRSLMARLQKWVEGGRYADLFDNVEDTLGFERLQVFDFDAMRAYPSLIEPLLFYILHRVNERLVDEQDARTLKLCVMDEAWRFIQNPTLRGYVQEALKTWRKRNAAMVLATQTIDDFASADLLRTVVESCPTRLLLANPALDRSRYAELFQMNEMELDLLAALMPRRQILLKRPDVTKVLTLAVDPKSYWIYTNTPIDNDRVAAVFREHGFEAGLDRLVASA